MVGTSVSGFGFHVLLDVSGASSFLLAYAAGALVIFMPSLCVALDLILVKSESRFASMSML